MKRIAVVGLLLAGSAYAQEVPHITPTRDVDVTYRAAPAPGSDAPTQRLRWDTADQLLRVDSPSPGLWMLVSYGNRTIDMVSDRNRSILELGAVAGPLPGQPGGAAYARGGTAQIAGLGCTDWQVTDTQGQQIVACITGDGVMLRAVRAGRVLIEAQQVVYGKQPGAIFQLPAGYARSKAPGAQ